MIPTDASSLVDVGCGDGLITVEIARRFPEASIVGIDLNPAAIRAAEGLREGLAVHNVRFQNADLRTLSFDAVDAALLLDILEHIDDDEELCRALGAAVRPGGMIIISTPTPNFPRFFGREFHEAVGHVRDGYTPDRLTRLLATAGFQVDSHRYYTKLPAALACFVFYRFLWKGKLGLVFSPVLNLWSRLDAVWPSSRGACSNIVVARRSRNLAAAELES